MNAPHDTDLLECKASCLPVRAVPISTLYKDKRMSAADLGVSKAVLGALGKRSADHPLIPMLWSILPSAHIKLRSSSLCPGSPSPQRGPDLASGPSGQDPNSWKTTREFSEKCQHRSLPYTKPPAAIELGSTFCMLLLTAPNSSRRNMTATAMPISTCMEPLTWRHEAVCRGSSRLKKPDNEHAMTAFSM